MTATIYETEVEAKVGDYILVGDRKIGEMLQPGDAYVDSGYAGSQFRIASANESSPINIVITGRTFQRRPHQGTGLYVRIRIIFVGDCEPDTECEGWLLVKG